MAGRKMKVTTNQSDRADQRNRTENVLAASAEIGQLQKTPPRYLTGIAFRAWNELWPILTKGGLVNQADKAIVASLCEQLSVKRLAYENVIKNGIVLANGRKNPACAVLNDSTTKVKSLTDSLGLNPQARISILSGNDIDDSEVDVTSVIEKMKKGDGSW